MPAPIPPRDDDVPAPGVLGPGSHIAASEPGDQVWGDYRIGRRLGAGGMGFVYEAVRLTDGAEVALKILRTNSPLDERLIQRFRSEPGFPALLAGNPHIVRVIEAGRFPSGAYYFVMERLAGGSLEDHLARFLGAYEPAARLAARVAHALEFIHGCGVIHRDLKPGNLLFRSGPGSPEEVVITDFGVARSLVEKLRFTATGEFVGTAAYAAPEQLLGSGTADARADVFAVGAILFRMVSGRHPVQNYYGYPDPEYVESRRTCPPASLVQAAARAGLPEPPWDLVYVCRMCLEPEPERRFSTAGALAAALDRYLGACSPAGLP